MTTSVRAGTMAADIRSIGEAQIRDARQNPGKRESADEFTSLFLPTDAEQANDNSLVSAAAQPPRYRLAMMSPKSGTILQVQQELAATPELIEFSGAEDTLDDVASGSDDVASQSEEAMGRADPVGASSFQQPAYVPPTGFTNESKAEAVESQATVPGSLEHADGRPSNLQDVAVSRVSEGGRDVVDVSRPAMRGAPIPSDDGTEATIQPPTATPTSFQVVDRSIAATHRESKGGIENGNFGSQHQAALNSQGADGSRFQSTAALTPPIVDSEREHMVPVELKQQIKGELQSGTRIELLRTETNLPPPPAVQSVVEQISSSITSEVRQVVSVKPFVGFGPAAPVVKTLELHLIPRELGPVIVRMSIADASLRISLKVRDAGTLRTLDAQRSELVSALKDTGYNLDELIVQAASPRLDASNPTGVTGSGSGYSTHMGNVGSHGGFGQTRQEGRGRFTQSDDKSREREQSDYDDQASRDLRSGIYL